MWYVDSQRVATDKPKDSYYCYESVDIKTLTIYADSRPAMRDFYTRNAEKFETAEALIEKYPQYEYHVRLLQ